MEFRSCEEYVLAELSKQCDRNIELEEEIELLKDQLAIQRELIENLLSKEKAGINNGTDNISS